MTPASSTTAPRTAVRADRLHPSGAACPGRAPARKGLLEAVAEHGYAQFLESKRAQLDLEPQGAVEDLRRGWDTVVKFKISRPTLFAVMNRATSRGTDMAHRAGLEILHGRVRRLAAGGWLRVDEELAAQIIQATGRGAVTTWNSTPAGRRNPALLTALREAMVSAITRAEPTLPAEETGAAAAARALRAALPDDADVLSDAEQHLLREWLTRLAEDGDVQHD
ncbi:TetR family transcriptional regulator [Kitasatospora aureofaciens]|uniref:TetR family transcriptional regulator n=1 Tax=Kitasatospora aureofaciens TaxID=1894 RepID=UPI001DC055BE|nr:TetR family transcriptional regulator [Kitasatospora aureofaciens]HJD85316.1 TetR family transcriptional regulator [Kitasatospora aureofaciens]